VRWRGKNGGEGWVEREKVGKRGTEGDGRRGTIIRKAMKLLKRKKHEEVGSQKRFVFKKVKNIQSVGDGFA
jgi:hypothetical protein